MAAVTPGLTPTHHDLLKEKDGVFSQSCQQSLQSLRSELDILFILRQEGILWMSLYWIYVPHPSVKVESTSSGEVEGGWIPRGKWGSYQKGVDIEEPPQGPLQRPCPTASPQAPLSYLLFPDLSSLSCLYTFARIVPSTLDTAFSASSSIVCVWERGKQEQGGFPYQPGVLQLSSGLTFSIWRQREFCRLMTQSCKTCPLLQRRVPRPDCYRDFRLTGCRSEGPHDFLLRFHSFVRVAHRALTRLVICHFKKRKMYN